MPGAGKSVLADYFVKKGYRFVRFGQITLDEIKRKRLKVNEKNERKIRKAIRKKYGMATYAILNYPKFKKLLKKHNVVADCLYSWSEYKYLKRKFANQVIVIAIYAPPNLRHKRLVNRTIPKNDKDLRYRPFTKKGAKRRDYAEIENLEKGGPIAMADYTIVNIESMAYFKKQIDKVHKAIQSKNRLYSE